MLTQANRVRSAMAAVPDVWPHQPDTVPIAFGDLNVPGALTQVPVVKDTCKLVVTGW